MCCVGVDAGLLVEDVKPYDGGTGADSGAVSNPGALPLLPASTAFAPLHSPLNLSGSHSGPAGAALNSPLDLSRNPSMSEPCGHTLGAPSMVHVPSGSLVQQSSFTSQRQLQAMAQARA